MAAPRVVTPLTARIRNFLLQRDYNNALRYEGLNVTKRTQPPPTLPDGPSHKLHSNYYLTRDGRGGVRPPTKVYDGNQQLLTAGASGSAVEKSSKSPVMAGFGYNWQTGRAEYN